MVPAMRMHQGRPVDSFSDAGTLTLLEDGSSHSSRMEARADRSRVHHPIARELVMRRDAPTAVHCALGVLAALVVHSGAAEAAARRVGIYVEGQDALEVREALTAAAPSVVTIVAADALFRGHPGPQGGLFAKQLDASARDAEVRRIREGSAAIGLDAVLLARVRREGTRRRVRLIVVDRAAGEKDLRDAVEKPGSDGADAELVSRAHEAFEPYAEAPEPPAVHSTPPPETQPAPKPETRAAPASVNAVERGDEGRDSIGRRPQGVFNRSLLVIQVGADAVGRHFDYNDGISDNLRSYNVAPAAMFSAGVEVFPFAGEFGILRDVGLTGSYARSLFLESALAGSNTISTVESAYSVGLRLRIHPWGDGGALIGVSDEYAAQSFVFDSAGAPVDGQVPSVDYRANRTAVDVRVPFGSFALLAGAGFRAVLSAGDVGARFRSTSVEGVDGELGASVTLAPGWEARLLLDYERYFYAFQPVPGDGYVAGGALDQFFGGRLAVAYVF